MEPGRRGRRAALAKYLCIDLVGCEPQTNWLQDFDQHEKNRHCGAKQRSSPAGGAQQEKSQHSTNDVHGSGENGPNGGSLLVGQMV
ncbi:hypothetical protein AV530_003847 [Patagioenas fasciata monilis]|uniref:Uncharacterized protein n=1 Tax=Patagioenas fasciata monilis TaxID=372326 RepID=A0A1V4KYX0_PATFA|nr:hypothetical protein AV530_003847 [Patagioenas fasciata monilis]